MTKAHSIVEFFDERRWLLGVVLVALLFAGSRFASTRNPEGVFLAFAVPVVCVGVALASLRTGSRGLRIGGALVALLAVGVTELAITHAVMPPPPVAEAKLSLAEPHVLLPAPPSSTFEVEAHAALAKGHGAAEGHFALELARSGTSTRVEGEFARGTSVTSAPRRGPVRQNESHAVDVARSDVTLPGSGPVEARLLTLDGAVGKSLRIAILPATPLGPALSFALMLLVAAGVALDLTAARQGIKSMTAAWLGLAAVLAFYLPRHFSRADALGGVIAALLVAAIAGGGVGSLLSMAAARLGSRARA